MVKKKRRMVFIALVSEKVMETRPARLVIRFGSIKEFRYSVISKKGTKFYYFGSSLDSVRF